MTRHRHCLDHNFFCLFWHKLHNNPMSRKDNEEKSKVQVLCEVLLEGHSSSVNGVVCSVCQHEIKSWAMIMTKWQMMFQ